MIACDILANSPVTVPDGTYQLGEGDTLIDYAAKWSYGYLVGTGDGFTTPYPPSAHGLASTARMRGWRLFGVWTDGGIVYVDEVVHVPNLAWARRLGALSNELAVWSLFEGKEVRL